MTIITLELKELKKKYVELFVKNCHEHYKKDAEQGLVFTLHPDDGEYKQDGDAFPMIIENFLVDIEFNKIIGKDKYNTIGFVNSRQKSGTIFMTEKLMDALEIKKLLGYTLRFEFVDVNYGVPKLLFLGIDQVYE